MIKSIGFGFLSNGLLLGFCNYEGEDGAQTLEIDLLFMVIVIKW